MVLVHDDDLARICGIFDSNVRKTFSHQLRGSCLYQVAGTFPTRDNDRFFNTIAAKTTDSIWCVTSRAGIAIFFCLSHPRAYIKGWPCAGRYWLEIGTTKTVTVAMFSKEFEKWAESYISWEGKNESRSLPSPTVQRSDLRTSKDGPHQRRSDPELELEDHKSILLVPSQVCCYPFGPVLSQYSSSPFVRADQLTIEYPDSVPHPPSSERNRT